MSVQYDFSNDFVFCHVMQDTDICKEVLEIILAENIAPIKNIISQKSLSHIKGTKAVRLDVVVETQDGKLYDIEMQVVNKYELPKRMRFYQSMLDLSYLQEGDHYKNLRDNYIIFICKFDYFKKNLPVYFFENLCNNDTGIKFNDGTKKIIINTTAFKNTGNKRLQQLLEFIQEGTPSNDLTRRINEMVEISRLHEAAKEFYQLISPYEMDLRDKWKTEGLEEGLAQGIAQGIIEGREQGLAQGHEQGLAQGHAQGLAEGLEKLRNSATNLKRMGLPLEQIAEATGLTLDEVNAL
ncbi:MAG: Rpn family recombination-promoting nuclease/putative transposase [Treponema sp.]|nr:Rpn family recombination-promoting nuclease/putative transposase [Treponema sp.]